MTRTPSPLITIVPKMIPPGPFVPLTKQFERSPLGFQLHVQGRCVCRISIPDKVIHSVSEWGPSGTSVASTSILLGSPTQKHEGLQFSGAPSQHSYHSSPSIPNSRYSGSHFPDSSFCSTPVNRVNLDPICAEEDLFALFDFDFDSSFVPNISDSAFTSLNLTQDGAQLLSDPELGLGLVFAEDPEVFTFSFLYLAQR